MSVLGLQSLFTVNDPVFAGRYVSNGVMGSATPFPGTIADGATEVIFTFNNGLMPIVGNSYLVTVAAILSDLTGAGTGAGAFLTVGLTYEGSTTGQTIPSITTGPGLAHMSFIVQCVDNPANPMVLSITNESGASITAGDVTITSISVIEVPNPVILVDATIEA